MKQTVTIIALAVLFGLLWGCAGNMRYDEKAVPTEAAGAVEEMAATEATEDPMEEMEPFSPPNPDRADPTIFLNRSTQKLLDFYELTAIASDPSQDNDLRTEAIELGLDMVCADSIQMDFFNPESGEIQSYNIVELLADLKKGSQFISSEIEFQQKDGFTPAGPNQYIGTLTYLHNFMVMIDGEQAAFSYQATAEIVLRKEVKKFGYKSEPAWEVYLGTISMQPKN